VERQTPRYRARSLVDLLVPDWRPNALQVLWGVRVAIVLIVLLAISSLISPQDGKTIWDTVQLLLTASIPIVIAFVGNRYTQQRAQDEALESYLDQVSQLLTDKEQPLHAAGQQPQRVGACEDAGGA
jgi:hypothetical protein